MFINDCHNGMGMRIGIILTIMLLFSTIVTAQESPGFFTSLLPENMEKEIIRLDNPAKLDRISLGIVQEELDALGVKGVYQEISREEKEIKSALPENDKNPLIFKKIVKVYRVNTLGKETYVTKVTISVTGNGLEKVEVIEKVSEEYLKSTAWAIFSEQPEILEKVPAKFKWQIDYIPPGETKDFSYTIEANVKEIPTGTIVAGYKPTFSIYFARFLYNGGWVVVLIAICIISYYTNKQYKKIKQKIDHKRTKTMFKKDKFFRK